MRILRLILAILGAVFLLALVLLLVAQTPPVRRLVLRKAVAALRSRGIDFHAASLNYNLFTLRASLTGVVVRSAEAPRLPPLATIPRVDLSARWGDLLHGRLGLASVTLVRPTIEFVRGPGGRDNLPRMAGTSAGGASGYFVDHLAARGGTLRVADPAQKLSMTLPWQLALRRDRSTGAYALRFDAGHGPPIRYAGRTVPLDRVQLDAVLRGERLDVSRLEVVGADSSISVSGSVTPIGTPSANLSIRLRADAAPWARILRLKQRVRGELEAQLAAAGPLSGLQISGTLRSTRLSVGSYGAIGLRARILLDVPSRRLQLRSADATLLGGTVNGEGRVALAASAGTSALSLRFARLDLDQLSRALKLPVRVASRAKGTAEGRWPGMAFSSGTWEAAVNLSSERPRPAPGVAPVTGSLTANWRNGDASVGLQRVRAMGAEVSGQVALASTKTVRGTLHAGVPALDDLLASLGAYLGRPPPLESEHLRGRARVDATLAGSLSAPEVTARVSLAGLQIGRPARKLPELDGRLTLRGGQAQLEARIPSLSVTADVHAGLRAPYPVQLAATMPKTSFAALPVKLPADLHGTVALEVHAHGNVSNWRQADATIRVNSLEANWRNLPVAMPKPAEIRYSSGKLGVQAALQVKDSSLELSGALPISGGPPGDVRLQGNFSLATLLGLVPQQQRPQAAGRIEISGDVRGNLHRIDPSIDIKLADGRVEDARLHSPLTALSIEAHLRGATLDLRRLSAHWAGAALEGSGRLPLAWFSAKVPALLAAKPEPAAFTFSADGLKLQSISGLPKTAGGDVSLRLQLSAARPALDAVRATLTVSRMDLSLEGLSFREPKPARITMENGVARIEQFALEGPRTSVSAEGTASLRSPRKLDVSLNAKSNAAVLASFLPSLSAEGPVELHLSVKGTPTSPQLGGFFEAQNVGAAIATPPVAAQDMNIRVNFAGSRATIAHFHGLVNGGQVTATGGLSYAGGSLRDANIHLDANGLFLQYPKGLKILSDAKIDLRSDERALRLGGQVTIVQGSYRETVNLEQDLIPLALGQKSSFTPPARRNALLRRLRFNLGIGTRSPIVVNNNLGTLALAANLRLTGGYYNMGLLGRMTIEQGGQLRLNERTYTIDTGTVTFTSDQSIEATPDIIAKTEVAGYSITLQITKQAGKIRTNLTSQPPLSQANIISVLLTGRTIQEARGQVGAIAQQEALSYVAGRLGQTLSSQVQGGLGLTTVRIEPSLISAESSPGARLMVGQDITPHLNLSYSINLADTGDQIWAAQYELSRRFTTRAIMQADNSFRFEMRRHHSFGGLPPLLGAAQALPKPPVIGTVEFTGSPGLPVSLLDSKLKLKSGKRYDFFKAQQGVERLRKLYAGRDYLEASIRTIRDFRQAKVDLRFHIDSGPRVAFAYEGWSPSSGTRKKVRQEWESGAFEEQRVSSSIAALRGALVRHGYLQATIKAHTTETKSTGERNVTFRIRPGARFQNVKLVFSGARGIPPSRLRDLLEDKNLLPDVYLDPGRVTNLLASYYRSHGYLAARVGSPRYQLDAKSGTGRTVIPIQEGQQFHVGKLSFEGNKTYPNAEIARQAGLKTGEPYRPALRGEAADRVRTFYLNKGFSDVSVRTASQQLSDQGVVNLTFRIDEHKQRVVEQIRITGTQHTSKSLVRKQLALAPGQVLANDKLGKSLTRLYQSGAYSGVDLEPQEVPAVPGLEPYQEPVRLLVKLHEVPPWDLSYGGYYDTDRGPGGVVDLSNHNMLGGARVIGFRTRYDDLFREAMIYLTQPQVHKFFPKADLSGYVTRDQRDAFVAKTLGLSFQQEVPLRSHYILTYGYRIERDITTSLDPTDTSLNSRQRVAPLTLSLTRETRNNILDATRGMFLSNNFEVGTEYLGSQVRYMRYVGQYFQYVPLSRPASVPFSSAKRARLVWASGLRIGLEGGLGGQEINPSQRFFAGGGTTIRGFAQDEVGPKDATGQPVGGNAVLILNQELRFPLFSIFSGSTFLDVGNVYPQVSDFNPVDVRSAAGLGLLIRTPIVLIRVDYGFKLDRRRGESLGQLYIGIGQAF